MSKCVYSPTVCHSMEPGVAQGTRRTPATHTQVRVQVETVFSGVSIFSRNGKADREGPAFSDPNSTLADPQYFCLFSLLKTRRIHPPECNSVLYQTTATASSAVLRTPPKKSKRLVLLNVLHTRICSRLLIKCSQLKAIVTKRQGIRPKPSSNKSKNWYLSAIISLQYHSSGISRLFSPASLSTQGNRPRHKLLDLSFDECRLVGEPATLPTSKASTYHPISKAKCIKHTILTRKCTCTHASSTTLPIIATSHRNICGNAKYSSRHCFCLLDASTQKTSASSQGQRRAPKEGFLWCDNAKQWSRNDINRPPRSSKKRTPHDSLPLQPVIDVAAILISGAAPSPPPVRLDYCGRTSVGPALSWPPSSLFRRVCALKILHAKQSGVAAGGAAAVGALAEDRQFVGREQFAKIMK